jgi:ABC-2 type transport system permease protein
MIALVPVWLILCLLFRPDFSAVTLQSLLLSIPALAFGFGINFLFGATITSLAFWTTRVYSLSEFYYALVILFAGQFVPLDLMPPLVQQIAEFLPFQLMRYFPIQLI